MSLEKDITEIRGLVEAKPIFKGASQNQLRKRREADPVIDKAEVVRQVRKGLDYQFESYPWRSMLRDIGLSPAEMDWAEEYLYYTVGCTDPTFKINEAK